MVSRIKRFLLWEPRWLARSRQRFEEAGALDRPPGVDGQTIEEFYRQNEARRSSEEVDLGGLWFDLKGCGYELSWVKDTQELYATFNLAGMAVPSNPQTGFPDMLGMGAGTNPMVRPIGRLGQVSDLDDVAPGWRDHLGHRGGIEWLQSHLDATKNAGSPEEVM